MSDLAKFVDELYDAKQAESAAKNRRIAAEIQIANLVETKDNGSKTVAVGNAGLKVTVKRGLIRFMDIPEEVMPVTMTDPVPAGFVFDPKAYEALKDEHPEIFAKVAKHVEVTPKKVSVTIKVA